MGGHDILCILKKIHEIGIIHRDIKPENVMLHGNKIFLIDFGLSKYYRTSCGKHIPMKSGLGMLGTNRFASLHVHNGYTASRRDDLEMLGNTLLYLYHGKLPWDG